MKYQRSLLVITVILAGLSIALGLADRFMRPSSHTLIVVSGTLDSWQSTAVTVRIQNRFGLQPYLSSVVADTITIAITPSTTVNALFTTDVNHLSGSDVSRQPVDLSAAFPAAPVRVEAYQTATGGNQLTAATIDLIRVTPVPSRASAMPQRPTIGVPHPTILR